MQLSEEWAQKKRGETAVQSLSHVWFFVTPWTAARQAFLSFIISQSVRKLTSIELVMPSNHLMLCHPLLLLPSIFPSIRIFSNESALHIRWLNYWSFTSASVLLMNIQVWFPLGLTGLISLQSNGLSKRNCRDGFSRSSSNLHADFPAWSFAVSCTLTKLVSGGLVLCDTGHREARTPGSSQTMVSIFSLGWEMAAGMETRREGGSGVALAEAKTGGNVTLPPPAWMLTALRTQTVFLTLDICSLLPNLVPTLLSPLWIFAELNWDTRLPFPSHTGFLHCWSPILPQLHLLLFIWAS